MLSKTMSTKPAWYGGNKIPASYLAKFSPKSDEDQLELPLEVRLFLGQMK
mgnify:CR=1 FL=1